MSVSVDTVYKTVLLILNKEQRGYMTPDEFNKIGSQVQREIFERYFEDINQQVRIQQSEFDYANRVYNTDGKIAEFKTENVQASPADKKTITGTNPFTVPSELYRLNTITYEAGSDIVELQRVTRNEYYNIAKSKLTKPTKSCPVYLYEDNKAIIYPSTIVSADDIKMQYVKKPEDIRWGYSIGDVGQYVYSPYVYDPTSVNIGDLTQSITSNNTTLITDGTYTKTITGAGFSGLELTITVSGNTITEVEVAEPGTGFTDGQTITLLGNSFPGTAPGGVGAGACVITLSSSDLFSGSQQGYIDFGLHNSERSELIINILMYAGIVIRDPQIVQTAMSQIQKEEVNEKQ
jgi:hypothetical protein